MILQHNRKYKMLSAITNDNSRSKISFFSPSSNQFPKQYTKEMLSAIFHWILVGLVLAIMIWPVFLALMSVTMTEWKKKAYRFMAGNSLSDIIFAILSYKWLMIWFHKSSWWSFIIWIVWALLFLGYWYYLFRRKEKKEDVTIDTSKWSWKIGNGLLMGRWFLMNSLNPSIWVFWITVVWQFIHRSHHATPWNIWLFIVFILLTFIATDIIKINSADWILRKLTIKNLDTLHTVAWGLLMLAWVIMLIRIAF